MSSDKHGFKNQFQVGKETFKMQITKYSKQCSSLRLHLASIPMFL